MTIWSVALAALLSADTSNLQSRQPHLVAMSESKQPRSLRELREELAALARLSSVTFTEIARIQRRIRELSEKLGRFP